METMSGVACSCLGMLLSCPCAYSAAGLNPSMTTSCRPPAPQALWDLLEGPIMDTTLALHHCTMRAVLRKHNGYESGTEGDSFILAFHDETSAVGALHARPPWPRSVLQRRDDGWVYHVVPPAFSCQP